MSATLATLDTILKEYFDPVARDNIYLATKVNTHLSADSEADSFTLTFTAEVNVPVMVVRRAKIKASDLTASKNAAGPFLEKVREAYDETVETFNKEVQRLLEQRQG